MMHVRSLLLLSSLLLPVPLSAQPADHRGGPWAADADGDGRIMRAEMQAWMQRRFELMDPDGDGTVAVEAMRRMLGHEGQAGSQEAGKGQGAGRDARGPGRGGFGGPGGGGPSGGGPGGNGGPPPGERPDGPPSGGQHGNRPPPGKPGAAMPYPEDMNDDGKIEAQEFMAPALAMFGDMDANGDGALTADELPTPPPPPGAGGEPRE